MQPADIPDLISLISLSSSDYADASVGGARHTRTRPRMPKMFTPIRSLAILPVLAAGALTGCGSGSNSAVQTSSSPASFSITGRVHGGQQPVVGSQIFLYAAGKTGTASAPRAMLTAPVVTVGGGSFNITGLYSCQAGDQVYIVASGGDAGAGPNASIGLMAALGPCSSLQANAASTFIDINEVTTVGAVYALAPYMTGVQNLGSDATTASSNALAAAFASSKTMVDTSAGQALATSTGNGIVPQTTINSLANSLAACINSASASSSSCSNLFSYTASGGSTPTDTLQAALNVAHSPATNASSIYGLASAAPPFQPTLTAAPATYAITVAHPSDVLLYHNDAGRTGTQPYETALSPANVSYTTFGKLYSFPVDSYLFAQPLYVGGVGMPDGNVHNLVIAATTHATVYAFDADNNNPAAGSLWSESLLPSGDRYPVANDYSGCSNPPEAGIVGTPVIDRAAQTVYLVVKSINSSTGVFSQKLHAISLIDGSERTGSPVSIAPVFAGSGDGSSGGTITFNAQRQLNRSALLIAPNAAGVNTVWVNFASHCDIGPYHGIIMGYNGASLANTASFIDTPNGGEGGIWMSNGGLTADSAGYIYALAGNGDFTANTNGLDYGDTAMKLAPPVSGATSTAMTLTDYFTPTNQADLASRDLDLGGAEGILITDSASAVAPHLMIGSDKNGSVYLLNTDNMMRYDTGPGNANGDIQDFTAGGTFIYNFAFFNNVLYTSTPVRAYQFHPGSMTTTGHFDTTPMATVNSNTSAPSLSANGTTNGILWMETGDSTLLAYNAATFAQLYNSSQAASSRDKPPTFVKFTSPVIANGKVFLSGQGSLAVYGPLN